MFNNYYKYGPPNTESKANPGLNDLDSDRFLKTLTEVPSFTTKSPPSLQARSVQFPTHELL